MGLTAGLTFRLGEVLRKIGVRVTLFSLLGVVLALIAPRLAPLIRTDLQFELVAGSVDALLGIIAASMLTVTTFSMSIIVSAFGAATSNATPRATRLLAEDSTAQTAVAIFLGSFLFSIVGIIGLAAGYYAQGGRMLLFLATLADIVLITWALLRWVSRLNSFGRLGDIVARIEKAATTAAKLSAASPALGADPQPAGLSPDAPVLRARTSGYVRHIDMASLDRTAADCGQRVEVLRMPGNFVHEGEALLRLPGEVSEDIAERLRSAFSLGAQRSFDQDARYGLIVLSEVASRALSAAVNDPGTAIEVLRAGTRVLRVLQDPAAPRQDIACRNVHAPVFPRGDAYREFFAPIARDGAGIVEVQQTLQDCLAALQQTGGAPHAAIWADRARTRASEALKSDWERALLD